MRDPELCRELLEVILNVPIERVEYPEEQKTIDIAQDARSVRLDVYVADGNNTVYDIEMQTVGIQTFHHYTAFDIAAARPALTAGKGKLVFGADWLDLIHDFFIHFVPP